MANKKKEIRLLKTIFPLLENDFSTENFDINFDRKRNVYLLRKEFLHISSLLENFVNTIKLKVELLFS
jgi:hypothetical protein